MSPAQMARWERQRQRGPIRYILRAGIYFAVAICFLQLLYQKIAGQTNPGGTSAGILVYILLCLTEGLVLSTFIWRWKELSYLKAKSRDGFE